MYELEVEFRNGDTKCFIYGGNSKREAKKEFKKSTSCRNFKIKNVEEVEYFD